MKEKKPVFIIAEAGVNHNGKVLTAKKLILAARAAKADAVKFQAFQADALATISAKKALYQLNTTAKQQSQLEMLKRLQLDRDSYPKLQAYARHKGIDFLCSPFDPESISLLADMGLEILKLPSGEITNLPYLRQIGKLKKKVILSTGMSNLSEIRRALQVLKLAGTPKTDITLLHCTTEYPARLDEVNLLAMCKLREEFGLSVGYSDHTMGIEVSIAAVALGATVIEKHLTLSRKMSGPDHKASLVPNEFKAMVEAIRGIERALGDGIKRPSPAELRNRDIVRKSIVAAKDIHKGEVFSQENITVKRPGNGLSPMLWDKVIGKKAKAYFRKEEAIKL